MIIGLLFVTNTVFGVGNVLKIGKQVENCRWSQIFGDFQEFQTHKNSVETYASLQIRNRPLGSCA